MIQSRIREIRKQRGLTLQQVAERIGTTAQTIGRLETGMRTLSIDWVERIAVALGADASELLALPEGGDIPISGTLGAGGAVSLGQQGVIVPRMLAANPIALRVSYNLGPFRIGDIVVCDLLPAGQTADALNRDCYVSSPAGAVSFGRVLSIKGKSKPDVEVMPLDGGQPRLWISSAESIAPAVMVIRAL